VPRLRSPTSRITRGNVARGNPDPRAIIELHFEITCSTSHHARGTCTCLGYLTPIEPPVRMASAVARLKARPFAKQGANCPKYEVLDATTDTYAGLLRLVSVYREDPLQIHCCIVDVWVPLCLRLPRKERLETLAFSPCPLGRLWAAGSSTVQHQPATGTVHVRSARFFWVVRVRRQEMRAAHHRH